MQVMDMFRRLLKYMVYTMKKSKSVWIVALVLLLALTAVQTCSAGVAISGSFYANDYALGQGEEISSKDIYVVVFNKEDKRVRVDVEYEAPEFITVGLSPNSSLLEPDEYERIYITLKADEDAIPGNYTVKVIAIINEVKGDLPIKVLTSAAQEANVAIVGEYASVDVAAVDPVGNIAPTALIRLYRGGYEMASANGELKKRVVPGNYTAKAYLLGEEAASEEFELAAYEEKRIELLIRSVYFEVFDVLPAKDEAGKIGYVYVVAVVKNLEKELPDASISLEVSGVTSETFTVYSSPILPLNRTEIKYNYISKEGWKSGTYEFTAKVTSNDTLYAASPTRTVNVPPFTEKNAVLLLVGVIALIIILVVVFYRRKKKR
jgi:LPXTG-motif cell wall-anchored protein